MGEDPRMIFQVAARLPRQWTTSWASLSGLSHDINRSGRESFEAQRVQTRTWREQLASLFPNGCAKVVTHGLSAPRIKPSRASWSRSYFARP
jgi:hypothetical protein